MNFVEDLEHNLIQKACRETAIPMENYMKNNFNFLGIKTEARRTIFKETYEKHKQEVKANFRDIAWQLFTKNEREFHQCAIDLLVKEFKKNYVLDDITFIEKLITTNSWWDSVDVLAKYILGGYLKQFPNETYKVVERFSNSENMWLNRSALLFQLSYKEKTDFELLKSECLKHSKSNEFFIQKAIGWVLRDYSRFDAENVKKFVAEANLKPLSIREALRNIK